MSVYNVVSMTRLYSALDIQVPVLAAVTGHHVRRRSRALLRAKGQAGRSLCHDLHFYHVLLNCDPLSGLRAKGNA